MTRKPAPLCPISCRHSTAGFTLVEVLVALVIFALIGMAGFTMLDQVLRTQRQTEGRLELLAGMQRAMHLITLDFSQARSASLTAEAGPDGTVVGLRRNATEAAGGSVLLHYAVEGGTFMRDVSSVSGAAMARQPLLRDLSAVDWQFYEPSGGWADEWPPVDRVVLPGQPVPNPQAVAVTLTLAATGSQLRKVVLLPGEAR